MIKRYPIYAELALLDGNCSRIDPARIIHLRVKVALLHAGWWKDPDERMPSGRIAKYTGEKISDCSRFLTCADPLNPRLLNDTAIDKIAQALDVSSSWLKSGQPIPDWFAPIFDEAVHAKDMSNPPRWVRQGMAAVEKWPHQKNIIIKLTPMQAVALSNCIDHVLLGYAGGDKVVEPPIKSLSGYIDKADLTAVNRDLYTAFTSENIGVSMSFPRRRTKRC